MWLPTLLLLPFLTDATIAASTPRAETLNGTYSGVHSSEFSTDTFFGIPYAQPPVGDLRLRPPQSLKTKWSGVRTAAHFGLPCLNADYGGGSEDCLRLTVVRPSGTPGKALPVVVFFYGGGWSHGTMSDPKLNVTWIVQQSAVIGKPIIAISLNYRVGGWGWLWSQEVVQQGVANLGLRDQRLALHWVQENIKAFGGDPSKVTIWGQSAGAVSVGNHLLAYNGRNDHLFRGAISESGALGLGLINPTEAKATSYFTQFVQAANCTTSYDKLACLRALSTDAFASIVRDTKTRFHGGDLLFGPLIDGDIVARNIIEQQKDGAFVDVPYICGQNTDEGTLFATRVNTDAEVFDYLYKFNFDSNGTIKDVMNFYPNDPPHDVPTTHPTAFGSDIGLQFKRLATMSTDYGFSSPRRLAASAWNAKTSPFYSYRFNTIPAGVGAHYGATHEQELPFTMYNIHGRGYFNTSEPYDGPNPFLGKPQTYKYLAALMSGAWISFIADGTPRILNSSLSAWPSYYKGPGGKSGTNYVFDALAGSHLEADTYRRDQILYLSKQFAAFGDAWGRHSD